MCIIYTCISCADLVGCYIYDGRAACIRMPIMHSLGFSWSALSRKHCAGVSRLSFGRLGSFSHLKKPFEAHRS